VIISKGDKVSKKNALWVLIPVVLVVPAKVIGGSPSRLVRRSRAGGNRDFSQLPPVHARGRLSAPAFAGRRTRVGARDLVTALKAGIHLPAVRAAEESAPVSRREAFNIMKNLEIATREQ
jgi:hypothetical protein